MPSHKFSKILAGLAISILILGVFGNMTKSALADTSEKGVQQQMMLEEEKAKKYLKQIGVESRKDTTKPRYGEFNTTTTKGTDRDRQADIEKAMKMVEEKAKATLRMMSTSGKNFTKANYGEFNTTSTKEISDNRQADIENAKKTSEEKAMQTLEKLGIKLKKNF
jgi:hypothetical protein